MLGTSSRIVNKIYVHDLQLHRSDTDIGQVALASLCLYLKIGMMVMIMIIIDIMILMS